MPKKMHTLKIGSELQYEVPDECPEDCPFSVRRQGQGDLCTRCPVFNCSPPKCAEDAMYMPVIEPKFYRDDWAREWVRFFTLMDNGVVPLTMIYKNI